MKKLSILVAAIAAALSFTSCETSHDDNPVLPAFKDGMTADFLNVPVMQNEYITLTQENESSTLNLTCSQPTEYGYAASVRYVPEISLSEDFSKSRTLPDNWTSVCSEIQITNKNIAEFMCESLGVETVADLPEGYLPVYVRVVANLYTNEGVLIEGHSIVSNVVSFKHVRVSYLAVWVKDVPVDLYLIGTFNGWAQGDAPYRFYTGPEKNTWVTKSFSMAAGETFKVSPANWNADFNGEPFNAGLNNDQHMKVDTPYELFVSKDSSDIPLDDDFTGVAQLVVKDGKYILTFIPD